MAAVSSLPLHPFSEAKTHLSPLSRSPLQSVGLKLSVSSTRSDETSDESAADRSQGYSLSRSSSVNSLYNQGMFVIPSSESNGSKTQNCMPPIPVFCSTIPVSPLLLGDTDFHRVSGTTTSIIQQVSPSATVASSDSPSATEQAGTMWKLRHSQSHGTAVGNSRMSLLGGGTAHPYQDTMLFTVNSDSSSSLTANSSSYFFPSSPSYNLSRTGGELSKSCIEPTGTIDISGSSHFGQVEDENPDSPSKRPRHGKNPPASLSSLASTTPPLISVFLSGLSLCAAMSFCLLGFHRFCLFVDRRFSSGTLLHSLELLCPLTSFLLYLSPASTVFRSATARCTKSLPVRMFVVQALANVLAIDYGIKTNQPALWLTNLAGLLIQVLWLGFHNYILRSSVIKSNSSRRLSSPPILAWSTTPPSSPSRRKFVFHVATLIPRLSFSKTKSCFLSRLAASLGRICVIGGAGQGRGWGSFLLSCTCSVCLLLYLSSFFAMEAVGVACTLSSVMLFTVPLTGLGTIIRTRNSDSLPIVIVAMMIICNGTWGLYGHLVKDPVVYVPSVIGLLLSILQLLLVLWCRNLLFRWMDFSALFSIIVNTNSYSNVLIRKEKKSWNDSEELYDYSEQRAGPGQLADPHCRQVRHNDGPTEVIW